MALIRRSPTTAESHSLDGTAVPDSAVVGDRLPLSHFEPALRCVIASPHPRKRLRSRPGRFLLSWFVALRWAGVRAASTPPARRPIVRCSRLVASGGGRCRCCLRRPLAALASRPRRRASCPALRAAAPRRGRPWPRRGTSAGVRARRRVWAVSRFGLLLVLSRLSCAAAS